MANMRPGPRMRRRLRRRERQIRWGAISAALAVALAAACLSPRPQHREGPPPAAALPLPGVLPGQPGGPDPGPGAAPAAPPAAAELDLLEEMHIERVWRATRRTIKPRPRRSPAPAPREVPPGVDPDPAWTATTGLDRDALPLHLLVLGTDAEGWRSDVIMLVRVEPATGRVAVLSLPRDTLAPIAGTQNRYPTEDKLGHASAYQDQEFSGPARAAATVERLLGVRVHRWVLVDLTAFVTLVDAIGGVDFQVPFNMVYHDPWQDLDINLPAGLQHLDGTGAMHLARWRKDNDGRGYGDTGRIRTQQALLLAILGQVREHAGSVLLEAPELARKVRTNLRLPAEASALALLAARLGADQIEWMTLGGHGGDPGTPDFGYWVATAAEIDASVGRWRGP